MPKIGIINRSQFGEILQETAKILEKKEDTVIYEKLAQEIHDAFVKEYFTPYGKPAVYTTTAYVVVLYMGLTPDLAYDKVRRGLQNRLKKNFYHLDTGFVGTPYLCRMLSENGMNGLAYHLLMEKGYPGWLYEVLMGATTIWERWNSVEPNGKISGTEMNSLSHYSYGSIVEWMFRNMAGINPCEKKPGFKEFRLTPMPDYRIKTCDAKLRAASGTIQSAWEIDGKMLKIRFVVPFDTEAEIVFPDASSEVIRQQAGSVENICQDGKNVILRTGAGSYEFCYEPTTPYRKTYSLDLAWEELKANPKTWEILEREYRLEKIPFEKELCTLEELAWAPFTGLGVTKEKREKLDRLLREVE